jgi:hypothetical protein
VEIVDTELAGAEISRGITKKAVDIKTNLCLHRNLSTGLILPQDM